MTDGEDRMKLPPVQDMGFYQRKKHDKWQAVERPVLSFAVADTHAHLHMLPDPAWELVRCAANGVGFLCTIMDPSEDADEQGLLPLNKLDGWLADAVARASELGVQTVPDVRAAVGVHPHNARLYSADVEARLRACLADPRVVAVGEIGLDYHYDFSPREVQKDVFRRQIAIAHQAGLPVALHLRSGEDDAPGGADNAHEQAFRILEEEGFPEAGTLLHCCSLAPDELAPWVEAGCYVAYGGAITFKKLDDARAGALTVPSDRLLTETDAPYMAPEPMRGAACTPAHVVFTAARLAELRGCADEESQAAFLRQLWDNAYRLLGDCAR